MNLSLIVSLGDKVHFMMDAATNQNDSDQARPSFLVGIMHVTKDPWLSIAKDGQIPGWEQSNYKNFSVIYFFGVSNSITSGINSVIENLRWVRGRYASYAISYFLMFSLRPWLNSLPKNKLVGKDRSKIHAAALRVKIPELTATMRWKKLSFLNYFLEKTDAEYVIISTSSSLINFKPIVEFIINTTDIDEAIYAGRIHTSYDCDFTSGSFTLMNRRSASLLLESRKLIPVHVMDDIGFGTAFKKIGLTPKKIESVDFDSMIQLEKVSREELGRIAHFRFKSGPLDSRGDVAIMKQLISKLHG